MPSSCLFCRIVQGETPAQIRYIGEHIMAFADIQPIAPVHVLLVPKQHVASLSELQTQHANMLVEFMMAMQQVAQSHGLDAGYRVVINSGRDGGQEVLHLHAHIIGGRRCMWPPG